MKPDLTNHLYVDAHEGILRNLFARHALMFLAKVDICRNTAFCAVFGPTATCIPENEGNTCELFDAKVALFNGAGILTSLQNVRHGHKYGHGGGWVEIDKHDSQRGVSWLKAGTSEAGKCSRFMGDTIRPEDILVAL